MSFISCEILFVFIIQRQTQQKIDIEDGAELFSHFSVAVALVGPWAASHRLELIKMHHPSIKKYTEIACFDGAHALLSTLGCVFNIISGALEFPRVSNGK
jgi:hypothetical protein